MWEVSTKIMASQMTGFQVFQHKLLLGLMTVKVINSEDIGTLAGLLQVNLRNYGLHGMPVIGKGIIDDGAKML